MPSRGDVFVPGAYYHIYNRGADRAPIFRDASNYEFLLRLVKQKLGRHGVTVIAYCLMPNHYHFLLRQDAYIPLSRFISSVFQSYVQALNRQQQRSGALFEGRFRHVVMQRDEQLSWLCRYIHLNPVRAGLVARPEDWPYSNYREWIGVRRGTLVDPPFVAAWFGGPDEYRRFVEGVPSEAVERARLGARAMD